MSAESRARRERPGYMSVRDLMTDVTQNLPMATTYATFAIASAILDLSDGVREVAAEMRKNREAER